LIQTFGPAYSELVDKESILSSCFLELPNFVATPHHENHAAMNSNVESKASSLDGAVMEKGEAFTQREEHPVFDRGFAAWATLTGGSVIIVFTHVVHFVDPFCVRFFVSACTFGYANSFGVYQDLYTRAGASTPSNISWIGSTQLFFTFAMGLPAGKLLDLGYFRHVILFGSLLYTFW
jgi:hypothetical protein